MNRYIAIRNELYKRIDDELRIIAAFRFEEDCCEVAKSMNERFSRMKTEEPAKCEPVEVE